MGLHSISKLANYNQFEYLYITCVDIESDTDNIQKVGVGLTVIPVLSHLDMSTEI